MDIHSQPIKQNYTNRQGPTISFKSISRNKKVTWANRFVRDHHDLVYDANPQSIAQKLKRSNKHQHKANNQQDSPSPTRTFEYSPFKQRDMVKTSHSNKKTPQGISPVKYLKGMQQYQNRTRVGLSSARGTQRKNNNHNQASPFNQYGLANQQQQINQMHHRQSQPNLLGLSEFEYQNTIQGRIAKRTNHHIDFNKSKTTKINNTNQIWYDFSKDIQTPQSILQKQKHKVLDKVHYFKSYSAHKLFYQGKRMTQDNGCGHGGVLDHFYQTNHPRIYQHTHLRTTKNVVNYRTMTAHPAIMKKLGTDLDYNTHLTNTLTVGDKKRPSFQISQTQRKLIFSRQVLSPKPVFFR